MLKNITNIDYFGGEGINVKKTYKAMVVKRKNYLQRHRIMSSNKKFIANNKPIRDYKRHICPTCSFFNNENLLITQTQSEENPKTSRTQKEDISEILQKYKQNTKNPLQKIYKGNTIFTIKTLSTGTLRKNTTENTTLKSKEEKYLGNTLLYTELQNKENISISNDKTDYYEISDRTFVNNYNKSNEYSNKLKKKLILNEDEVKDDKLSSKCSTEKHTAGEILEIKINQENYINN